MNNNTENPKLSAFLSRFSAKILEWKEKYTNIYYYKAGSHEYVFRLLSKLEYLAFSQFHGSAEAEDLLLQKCVLFPHESCHRNSWYWGTLNAGEVASVIDKILSISGFFDLENIKKDIDKAREGIRFLDNQIVLLICKAFPQITPSDIDKFDYPTIIHYIALAEALLDTKLEIAKLEDQNKIDFDKDNKERGVPSKRIFPGTRARKK